MITYQVEKLEECLKGIEELLDAHFDEISTNKEKLGGQKMDVPAYVAMENNGALHILTARNGGEIVGYYVAFVTPHPHYAHSLTAFTDVYYIKPSERKGSVGIKLFKEAERTLKKRGVQRIFSGTKRHKDVGKLFEYLGWTETERLFVKWIGD